MSMSRVVWRGAPRFAWGLVALVAMGLWSGCSDPGPSPADPVLPPALDAQNPPSDAGAPAVEDVARPQPDFAAGPAQLRRLSGPEWRQSVASAFASPLALDLVLPEDPRTHGLTSLALGSVTVSNLGVEQYESASYDVARVLARVPTLRAGLLEGAGCPALEVQWSTVGEEARPALLQSWQGCLEGLVRTYGRRLWRRTLEGDEVARYAEVAQEAAHSLDDFDVGLEFAMAGLLQSPNFLYRMEYGEPDPERPGFRRLTGLEVAARLSYLLHGTGPADALIDLAESGGLDTPEARLAQAAWMLEMPATRENFARFWGEYLELYRLDTVLRDREAYPEFDQRLLRAMRHETVSVMNHLAFTTSADMREMFTTRTTFLNRLMIRLYAIFDVGVRGDDTIEVQLAPGLRRAGILGHASILTAQSHVLATSPTHRGKFIREALLCQSVPPPPPNVDTSLPPMAATDAPQTLRQRLEAYAGRPECGSCHAFMDTLGFGLEHYDAIGRRRLEDNGLPVDASGMFNEVAFEDAVGLGEALAMDGMAMDCMVRKTFRHTMGRMEARGEDHVLETLQGDFARSGYRFRDLILAIVASDSFAYVREVP